MLASHVGLVMILVFLFLIRLYSRLQICDAVVADRSGKTVFCVEREFLTQSLLSAD